MLSLQTDKIGQMDTWTDAQKDGPHQNNIPPPMVGDNKIFANLFPQKSTCIAVKVICTGLIT